MKIINLKRSTVIAQNTQIADSFFKRFMGLMGRRTLEEGSGLMLTPCKSVHMFFMLFPIDVIFIDRDNIVVALIENIKPWRVSKIYTNAYSAIELPIYTISKSKTKIGDVIVFKQP